MSTLLSRGGKAANVMVAIGVSAVLVSHAVAARDDVDRAVGQGRVMHRRPHRRALEWVVDLEISVVLMPASAHALLARFQEDLIEMQHDRVVDQLAHGRDRLVGEGHGAVERAMREDRAELQVDLFVRRGNAIASSGDIAQQADRLQTIQLAAHSAYFALGPDFVFGHPAFAAELIDFARAEHRFCLVLKDGLVRGLYPKQAPFSTAQPISDRQGEDIYNFYAYLDEPAVCPRQQ